MPTDLDYYEDCLKPLTDLAKERMAQKIRQEIAGGQLLGKPIDPNDQDAMLVAAYCIGLAQVEI